MQVSSCSLFCRGSRLSSRTAATRASLDCCSSSVGYSSTRASTFRSCITCSSILQLFRVNLLYGRQLADHAGGLLLATEQAELAVTTVAAVAEAEATTTTLAVGVRIREGFLGQLAMAGRNHEAVLVVGDGQVAVHFVRLGLGQPGFLQGAQVFLAFHGLGTLVQTHGHDPLQSANDGLLVTGGQQVRQVLDRNPQAFDLRQYAVELDLAGFRRRLDRAERRHVPHHGQGAVFRVQRQGQFPVHRHFVHRALLGGFDHVHRDAVFLRLFDHCRVERVQEDFQLLFIQLVLARGAGHFFNAVCVVQQHTEVADTAYTGLGADGRQTGFDTRVAENTLLGLAGFPVEVDLLVRAAGDTHPPAAALVLVDQHNTVFFALVDGTAGATGYTRRVQAVLAQARQVHHEGVFELAVDVCLHLIKVLVFAAFGKLGAQNFFPVRAPFDFLHALARDQRPGPGDRLVLHITGGVQVLVVVVKRFVVVINFRQVRVGEDVRQYPELATDAGADLAGAVAHPAALPFVLVLPLFRVANTGLGFDVVEPGVFHAFTACPYVFAGDGTGVATNALVQVQHHADLGTDFHFTAS